MAEKANVMWDIDYSILSIYHKTETGVHRNLSLFMEFNLVNKPLTSQNNEYNFRQI